MPCSQAENLETHNEDLIKELHDVTDKLCRVLFYAEFANSLQSLDPDVQAWWEKHKEWRKDVFNLLDELDELDKNRTK
jgi:hypothetical protein